MKQKNLGMIVLAAFLIYSGLTAFVSIGIPYLAAILAIAAGVLILMGK